MPAWRRCHSLQVYPFYLAKIEKKGRTKEELHQVIHWLTGFDEHTI
jgi:hypothetical protein